MDEFILGPWYEVPLRLVKKVDAIKISEDAEIILRIKDTSNCRTIQTDLQCMQDTTPLVFVLTRRRECCSLQR